MSFPFIQNLSECVQIAQEVHVMVESLAKSPRAIEIMESFEGEVGKMTAILKAGKPLTPEQQSWLVALRSMDLILAHKDAFNISDATMLNVLQRAGEDETANKYIAARANHPSIKSQHDQFVAQAKELSGNDEESAKKRTATIQSLDRLRVKSGQVQRNLANGKTPAKAQTAGDEQTA